MDIDKIKREREKDDSRPQKLENRMVVVVVVVVVVRLVVVLEGGVLLCSSARTCKENWNQFCYYEL